MNNKLAHKEGRERSGVVVCVGSRMELRNKREKNGKTDDSVCTSGTRESKTDKGGKPIAASVPQEHNKVKQINRKTEGKQRP